MPITIGSNIASLNAQRRLADATSSVSRISERLSSGQRINRASDDAAGLAISSSLKADARIFGQAIRNLNDGVSLINIADGALSQLSEITQRQFELAEQAANGTYSLRQRWNLNQEMKALSQEYNRILQSTSFNGLNLFSDSVRNNGLALQVGYGQGSTLQNKIGDNGSRTVGDGTYTQNGTVASGLGWVTGLVTADLNGDGIGDLIASNNGSGQIRVSIGNSDGTFGASSMAFDLGSFPGSALRTGDFNGDGIEDIFAYTGPNNRATLLIGNGNGTFRLGMSFVDASFNGHTFEVADINGDGRDDIVQSGFGLGRTYLGNADGTFRVGNTFSIGFSSGSNFAKIIKDELSGQMYALFGARSQGTTIMRINADGTMGPTTQTFSGAMTGLQGETADINGDGIGDLVLMNFDQNSMQVYLGNGNGTFGTGQSISTISPGGESGEGVELADINGDGILDLIQTSASGIITYRGNGNGTFGPAQTTATATSSNIVFLDLNRDGVLDALINDGSASSGNLRAFYADTEKTLLTKQHDITTQSGAREALTFLKDQIDRISSERGSLGAFMSRLNIATNTTRVTQENYLASNSRIEDADIAQEVADYTRANILQQIGASILSQANQQNRIVLDLLRS